MPARANHKNRDRDTDPRANVTQAFKPANGRLEGLRDVRPRVGIAVAILVIWLAPARAQRKTTAGGLIQRILVSRQLAARAHLPAVPAIS